MVDGRRRTTTDDGRTPTDGRRLDGYTISSPCEPKASGELKIIIFTAVKNCCIWHRHFLAMSNVTAAFLVDTSICFVTLQNLSD